jgi:hypothetical protein
MAWDMWPPFGPRRKDKWRLLEEVELVSGPVGAAKLDDDDEMAKVARIMEELEGNFMIKEVDNKEMKTSTSGKGWIR